MAAAVPAARELRPRVVGRHVHPGRRERRRGERGPGRLVADAPADAPGHQAPARVRRGSLARAARGRPPHPDRPDRPSRDGGAPGRRRARDARRGHTAGLPRHPEAGTVPLHGLLHGTDPARGAGRHPGIRRARARRTRPNGARRRLLRPGRRAGAGHAGGRRPDAGFGRPERRRVASGTRRPTPSCWRPSRACPSARRS